MRRRPDLPLPGPLRRAVNRRQALKGMGVLAVSGPALVACTDSSVTGTDAGAPGTGGALGSGAGGAGTGGAGGAAGASGSAGAGGAQPGTGGAGGAAAGAGGA